MADQITFTERYHKLIDEICEEAGIPDAQSMYQNCSLVVNDIGFTMAHMAFIKPETAILYADFGKPPTERRDLVLQRLMESNLLTYCESDAPSFAYAAETGHVVLMTRLPLSSVTGENVIALMKYLTDYAQLWRETFFLNREEARQ